MTAPVIDLDCVLKLTDCLTMYAATVFVSEDAVNIYCRIVEDVCSISDVYVAVNFDFDADDVVRLDATAEASASCDFDAISTLFNQSVDYLFESFCLHCVSLSVC